MAKEASGRYNRDQILTAMDFFGKYAEIWRRAFGEDFFTRDHWFVFNECCRSFWQGRDFTISDAIRTMPLIAPTVARTRIDEAEKAGYLKIAGSNRDARTKLVLPTEELERKVETIFERSVDLLREALAELADEGRLPRD